MQLIGVQRVRQTAKAILISYKGQKIWLPFSQITKFPVSWQDLNGTGEHLEISEYIAREKGISGTDCA